MAGICGGQFFYIGRYITPKSSSAGGRKGSKFLERGVLYNTLMIQSVDPL